MTEVVEMPSIVGRRVDRAVDGVLGSMEAARRALDEVVEALLTEDGAVEDVSKAAQAVSRAHGVVTTEWRRVEDARRIERGGDGLDMAAARAEIECRLGRILAGGET